MRLFIIALGVLCLALPGMASTTTSHFPTAQIEYSTQEISPELLESIFRYLQQHYDYDLETLYVRHKAGEVTVSLTSEGYRVSVSNAEGLDLILILEDL